MTDFSIDQARLDQLKTELDGLSLDDDQRKVLNGMIKIAGDLLNGEPSEAGSEEPRAFSAEFTGAFTPEQASVIVEYAATPKLHYYVGATEAHGSGAAITAMITR